MAFPRKIFTYTSLYSKRNFILTDRGVAEVAGEVQSPMVCTMGGKMNILHE
jgi:hypothetical protein